MHGSEFVLLDQTFVDENRILKIVAPPGHERHFNILPQSQLTLVHGRPVGQNFPGFDIGAGFDHRDMIETGILVGTHKLG